MLEDLRPGGFVVLAKLLVAPGECAEWTVRGSAGLAPGRPGALLAEQPPRSDDPLASRYSPLARLTMTVARATRITVGDAMALLALLEVLTAAGGAELLVWLSCVSHVISLQRTKGVTGSLARRCGLMPTASRVPYVRVRGTFCANARINDGAQPHNGSHVFKASSQALNGRRGPAG